MVPALIAAQTNLAQITATNFTLLLPKAVTHVSTVTLDYGDVVMLRAMLNAGEVFGYSLYSMNADAQITAVSNIISKDNSVEAILTAYPNLLTYATTSDKAAAQAAFSNAASLYLQASDFIRNDRPPGATYLFNLGSDEQAKELSFRQTLTNLLLSLNGTPQPLPKSANTSVSMAAFFSETRVSAPFCLPSMAARLCGIAGRTRRWAGWCLD